MFIFKQLYNIIKKIIDYYYFTPNSQEQKYKIIKQLKIILIDFLLYKFKKNENNMNLMKWQNNIIIPKVDKSDISSHIQKS